MAFQPDKLARSLNQESGIFDKFIYKPDNGDTITDITTDGYFSTSVFSGIPNWVGSIIEIEVDGFYYQVRATDDNVFILYDSAVAEHFKYDRDTKRLVADVSFQAPLDSIYLGGIHKSSSAGYGVMDTNLENDVSSLPATTGVKDHSDPANRLPGEGIVPVSGRDYGEYQELEPNGPMGAGSVVYEFTVPVLVNTSIYGATFEVTDAITPDEELHFHAYIGTDTTGTVIFSQTLTGLTVAAGGQVVWWFDHPVDIKPEAGFITFRNEKDEQDLFCTAGTIDTNEIWYIAKLRFFEDVPLALSTDFDKVLTDVSGHVVINNNGNLLLSD